MNTAYLDSNLSKMEGNISYFESEKDYNEFRLQQNKQSVEEILIQRAVKTTIQMLYDKGLIDIYANADEVLEDFLFTTRRRGELKQVNDDIQRFCSWTQFKKQCNKQYKLYDVLKKMGLDSTWEFSWGMGTFQQIMV